MKSSFSVIISFIAVALLGCLLAVRLPVKLFPSRQLPTVNIAFSMPATMPRVIEQEVTSRIEGIMARISGVKNISSVSSVGNGSVTLELDRHADIDAVRFEVSAAVRQIWGDLPEGVSYPSVSARQSSSGAAGPFMTYTAISPMSPVEIQQYLETNIKPALADIPGVARVEIYGATPMVWKLEYDADRLAALGLSPSDLQNAIAGARSTSYLGVADNSGHRAPATFRGSGDPTQLDLSGITVQLPEGRGVMEVERLVRVVRSEGTPRSYYRINGRNSVYLSITADDEANQLDLGNKVADVMASLERELPQSMRLIKAADSTEIIREELDKIYVRTGLTIAILLMFVFVATLNLRYSLLIMISLALSLGVSALFWWIAGIELQLYSLAGITISLNLIIDNIIVVGDHYLRRHDLKAFTAVLAATLTTIGALGVVFFLPEEQQLNLRDFVIVVIINLTVSLAAALFLIPALVSKMGVRRRKSRPTGHIHRRIALTLLRIHRAMTGFTVRFRVVITILLLASIGGSAWLFFKNVREGRYYDNSEGEVTIFINATLPSGATIAQMNDLVRKMEQFLSEFQQIRRFETSIYGPNRASITVRFTPEAAGTGFPYRLKSDVISRALTLGGGSWGVYGLKDNGFSNDVRESAGSVRIKLRGYDYDELRQLAETMRDSLLTHRRIREVDIRSEFSYWKDDYSEYSLTVDKELLAAQGLTVSDFYAAIMPVLGRDIDCGAVINGNFREQILLNSRQSSEYDVWSMLNIPVEIGGRRFAIGEFVDFGRSQAPQDIRKENQSYVLCLQYEYIGSGTQSQKIQERRINEFNDSAPAGYKAEKGENGWSWDNGSDYKRYWLLGLVAAIIFFMSSILFNSLRQPLVIIAVIPVSFIGAFLTFWFFELKFDQGGFASFILLSGITVNAAIYIINEYNMRRRRWPHRPAQALYLQSVRVKIGPILLTVLSTVLGFLPFIIGTSKESFWFPLAVGTISGLLFSLPAVLLFMPMFLLPRQPRKNEKLKMKN